ncbi:MAG: monovalent cation:proton antiporter-2 (CPA2) family protein [Alphaproteobacteria bacterium]
MSVGSPSDIAWLHDAVVYLGAAVVVAPLCVRIGTSPILGYLLAGVVLGPYAFGIVNDIEGARGLADFGVVLLMFTIGLELSFQRLRMLARQVFGFGFVQVVLTAAGVFLVCRYLGLSFEASLLIGCALSLSSTALVLRLLAERAALQSKLGRLVFATLLFQDLAVAPMLAAAPLIAVADEAEMPELATLVTAFAIALFAICGIIVVGRFAMRPFLKMIHGLHNREVFAAASLLIVLLTAWAGAAAGLSMALGAFLAGMVLAGSGFRHQVENEIVPFRGLLLGLFFMSIGALIDVGALLEMWREALLATVALIVFKTTVIACLARMWGFPWPTALHGGLLLAQGGEFAFALAAIAMGGGLLTDVEAQIFLLATALSLGLTPALAAIGARLDRRLESRGLPSVEELEAAAADLDGHVVVFGFGRAGQTLTRVLAAAKEQYIVIDQSPARVTAAAAEGQPVFYADGTKERTLDAVGIDRMRLAIVGVGDSEAGAEIVVWLKTKRPDLTVYARAANQTVQEKLKAAGADVVVREIAESSLHMGGAILRGLGRTPEEAATAIDAFRQDEYKGLEAFLDPEGERYGKKSAAE